MSTCRLLASLIVISLGANWLAGDAYAQVFVRGYVTREGTLVEPHVRSSPNGDRGDNYGTRGNVNPFTGRRGHHDVYAPRRLRVAPQPMADRCCSGVDLRAPGRYPSPVRWERY